MKDILEDIYYTNFINAKNLSEASNANYEKTLRKFTQALNTTLEDIITGCKNQQDLITEKIISHGTDSEGNQIIEKKITIFDVNSPESLIKQYFDKYIEYCKKRNNSNNTINMDLDHIKTFLKFYSVTYPKTNIKRTTPTWNLLTKEDIKFVMDDSLLGHKCLISALKDTGLRLSDVINLTIDDFMIGTSRYHDFVDVDEFIDNAPDDMICVLEFIPQKTKRFNLTCITCIGPETCNLLMQNLRKIKNEYLPQVNRKQGLDLRMSKTDALFGNKQKYFKGPMQVKSIADIFSRKNKKLREYRITKINDAIKKGEISIEDKEKEMGRIPKFHAHALRKFFQTTIAKNCGNLRICTLMEGHTSPVKTDSSYIQIGVEDVLEVYMSALPDLSLENTETRVYTSDIRREMEAKMEALGKENESLRQKYDEKEEEANQINERLLNIENWLEEIDKRPLSRKNILKKISEQ